MEQNCTTSIDLLSTDRITKTFPGVKALDQVSIGLRRGEVHALIGENGAGKSTLIKILAGILQPDEGAVLLNGKRARLPNPLAAQQVGIGIVFQELNLVSTLDVATNMFLGHEKYSRAPFLDRRKMFTESKTVLDSLGVELAPSTMVSDLTISQVQMIAIARALSFKLRVLLLDEPTSSLSEGEIEKLYGMLNILRDKGVGILYVSHRLEEIFQIADRVTVLRDGKWVDTKGIKETTVDEIITKMVGRTIVHMYPKEVAPVGREALRARGISKRNVIENIDITLRQGEIVGLFGLIGAGRTELARMIFGLDRPDEGEVFVWDKKMVSRSSNSSIAAGLGYLPEDRHAEGLCGVLSIRKNITRASQREVARWGVRSLGKEKKLAVKYVEELRIATPSMERPVNTLSGGNQQKVVFAHWLCARTNILILDEPTRGIDVGTKVEIYRTMNRLVKEGAAILLISSDLPELINMSDRVYVMYKGKISGALERSELDPEKIIAAAIGVEKTK